MKSPESVIKINVLEERLTNMIRENSEEHTKILKSIDHLSAKVDNLQECFVSKKEFDPVKNITYGIVWLIVAAVIGALLKLVILG